MGMDNVICGSNQYYIWGLRRFMVGEVMNKLNMSDQVFWFYRIKSKVKH